MVASTASRLEVNTQKSLREIAGTKYVLYVLIGIVPFVSAVLGFVFISGLTSPVSALVASTRKLKGGDLDHRVAALKYEFGELADAFNEMAASLKEQMLRARRAEQLGGDRRADGGAGPRDQRIPWRGSRSPWRSWPPRRIFPRRTGSW